MKENELKARMKQFGIETIRYLGTLPRSDVSRIIANQLMRAATSVGANYRAACRARSTADFIAKMGIVEEELDESMYWLELLGDLEIIKKERASRLMDEGNQLLSIVVASIKTARFRRNVK